MQKVSSLRLAALFRIFLIGLEKKAFIFLSFFFLFAFPAFACTVTADPSTVLQSRDTNIAITTSNFAHTVDNQNRSNLNYIIPYGAGYWASKTQPSWASYTDINSNNNFDEQIGTVQTSYTENTVINLSQVGTVNVSGNYNDNTDPTQSEQCNTNITVVAAPPPSSCTVSPSSIPANTDTPVTFTVNDSNYITNWNFSYGSATIPYTGGTFSSFTQPSWESSCTNYTTNIGCYVNTQQSTYDLQAVANIPSDKPITIHGDDGDCVTTLHVAPTVGTITVTTSPVQVNNSITASANFTGSTGTYTASWNWGDGNTTTGTVTEPNGSTPGSVSDTHTYTTAGVYTITLTVTDQYGGTGTNAYQYISVYNPTSQGLFSAGHKFTSPAGAYPQNASLTGDVTFGLSYKYQGSMPVGDRQFTMNFKAANLLFNATSISSLVISNNMATLTGTGTINGLGNYNFLVTGVNGGDIRIQITDPANNNNVIYDTQPGAAATATPATSVNGQVIAHN